MSISINTTRYSKFISEVNTLLPTGTRVIIHMFSDQEGSVHMNDSNGSPINGKQFSSLSYHYPIDDAVGCIHISFDDGSSFQMNDGVEGCWFTINGISEGVEPFV